MGSLTKRFVPFLPPYLRPAENRGVEKIYGLLSTDRCLRYGLPKADPFLRLRCQVVFMAHRIAAAVLIEDNLSVLNCSFCG